MNWKTAQAIKAMGIRYAPFLRTIKRKLSFRKKNAVKAALKECGIELLSIVQESLGIVGLPSYAAYGTLLGIIRENGLIAHDLDLDVSFVPSSTVEWDKVERALTSLGFEKIREFAYQGVVTEQTYALGILSIDVFGMFPTENGVCRSYFYNRMAGESYGATDRSAWYIDLPEPIGMEQRDINGQIVRVPDNAISILEKAYGDNWRVPDPTFRHEDVWTLLDDRGECLLYLR